MKWLLVFLGVVVFLVALAYLPGCGGDYTSSRAETSGLSVLLFILGVCLSLAGIWSVVQGVKRFRIGSLTVRHSVAQDDEVVIQRV